MNSYCQDVLMSISPTKNKIKKTVIIIGPNLLKVQQMQLVKFTNVFKLFFYQDLFTNLQYIYVSLFRVQQPVGIQQLPTYRLQHTPSMSKTTSRSLIKNNFVKKISDQPESKKCNTFSVGINCSKYEKEILVILSIQQINIIFLLPKVTLVILF